MADAAKVIDNIAARRFETELDGRLSQLAYQRHGDRLVLIHTEVPPELEGRGVGGELVAAALATARREGLTVVPLCPFARHWLERHRDIAEGVSVDWGGPDPT